MALVEIAAFADVMAAEIARGRLASEGIDALLFDAGLSGLGLGTMVPARLMVDEADAETARSIVEKPEDRE
jgi:hypothetical protein